MKIDKSEIRRGYKLILEVNVEKVNSAGTIICSHHINITDNNIDCVKEVIKKPFKWKDAQQGMAFKDENGGVVYFVAHYAGGKHAIYTTELPNVCTGMTVMTYNKDSLTRYPEGDIIYD